MKRVIICDFFGVITPDTFDAWLSSKGLVRDDGMAEASRLADLGEIDSDEFFTRIASADDSDGETVELEFEHFEVVDEGMVELLKRLHRNHRNVLVSNSNAGYIRKLLDSYDLNRLFDDVVISSDVGQVKPDTAIFEQALKLADVDAHEAVFIDDRLDNVNGAASIGIESILFSDVEQVEQELQDLGITDF